MDLKSTGESCLKAEEEDAILSESFLATSKHKRLRSLQKKTFLLFSLLERYYFKEETLGQSCNVFFNEKRNETRNLSRRNLKEKRLRQRQRIKHSPLVGELVSVLVQFN